MVELGDRGGASEGPGGPSMSESESDTVLFTGKTKNLSKVKGASACSTCIVILFSFHCEPKVKENKG